MLTTAILWSSIVAVAAWQLIMALSRVTSRDGGPPGSIEMARRARLRRTSLAYAVVAPLVRRLGDSIGRRMPRVAKVTGLALRRSGDQSCWLAEEWLGARVAESLLLALATVLAGARAGLSGAMTLLLSLAGAVLLFGISGWLLNRRAKRRIRRIRARLPFVIDAVALLMEAGATFRDGLAFAARNCGDHPVSDELARCLAAAERGQPTSEALDDLATRLGDPLVYEFVSTAVSSMKKGHAVSASLLAMSVRMRLRRAHEIESAAGRAQVQLQYPGLLLLLVCMAVMAAPFLAPLGDMMQTITPTQP